MTGHLLWHSVDKRVTLELLLAWNRLRCRPPLEDEEVVATVGSVARTPARHRGNGGAPG
ncbi:MAG: primase C-terminal domain-containing protein [Alphaproteobacteria bacterium]|nr:primase C-terminal domain-containing protein [Alphaproteobacteria bacterium]